MPTPRRARLALGVAAALGLAATSPAPAYATTYPLGRTVSGAWSSTSGPIFPRGIAGGHTCSGTITSAGGEAVVITAAHCVSGTARGWSFVPGYRGGAAPFGVWTVEAAFVDQRWNGGRNSAYDVAILRLAKKQINGRWRGVHYLAGSTVLTSTPRAGTVVDILGWQQGRTTTSSSCSNRITTRNAQPYTWCSYVPAGLSGAGLRYGTDGRGHQYLGGLVGGYHQGGCLIQDAYSPAFGPWVRALVTKASAGTAGQRVAPSVGDGCL